jgi:hypothetical protein
MLIRIVTIDWVMVVLGQLKLLFPVKVVLQISDALKNGSPVLAADVAELGRGDSHAPTLGSHVERRGDVDDR